VTKHTTTQSRAFDLPKPPSEFFIGRDKLISQLDDAIVRGASAPVAKQATAIVLSDIEGCLNLDPRTYDHAVLSKLREVNEQATWTNALPFITLCTGRQAPFVDAFSAFLSVRLPVIFEGGCGLFFPTEPPGARHQWHPLISDANAERYRQLEVVVSRVATDAEAKASLGKGRLLTYHPSSSDSVDDLVTKFTRALAEEHIDAVVTRSANAVDISVAGITKGTAVSWLLDTIHERGGPALTADQVVGLGDAPNDVAFLEVVGTSVAPANAEPGIATKVDRQSIYTDAKAVAETVIAAISDNLAAP
jgi:hydroxymethylpyrimidine pyrophosphatase-like HAD family hydrolase